LALLLKQELLFEGNLKFEFCFYLWRCKVFKIFAFVLSGENNLKRKRFFYVKFMIRSDKLFRYLLFFIKVVKGVKKKGLLVEFFSSEKELIKIFMVHVL